MKLNCILLLDSAIRFGLMQGGVKFACDARKTEIRVSLSSVNNQ